MKRCLPPLPPPLPAAAVGTLLNLKNSYIQVNVTEVLFPSRLQPGLHTIRQFIIPDSMRCCNRLVLGNSYLFTGRFFGPLLFTRGCRDIFYYRHDNQTLLYSQNTATLAGFHPFSCWQIVVSSLETTSLSLSAEQGIFFSVCTSFFSILLPIIIIILHHYTYLPHFIVWCRTNHSPPFTNSLHILHTQMSYLHCNCGNVQTLRNKVCAIMWSCLTQVKIPTSLSVRASEFNGQAKPENVIYNV